MLHTCFNKGLNEIHCFIIMPSWLLICTAKFIDTRPAKLQCDKYIRHPSLISTQSTASIFHAPCTRKTNDLRLVGIQL